MKVVVRIGLSGQRGTVVVDGDRFRARRSACGTGTLEMWTLDGPEFLGPSRVSYSVSGRLVIDGAAGHVEVPFRPQRTEFSFRNRTYTIGDLRWGEILISDRDRIVVRGHGTPGGVRLETVEPDLDPIVREVAWGLAVHAYDLAREYGFGRGAA